LLFSMYVAVLCARTKGVKARWLWVIFSLVGVSSIAVNWTTGEWNFTLLYIAIPTAREYLSGMYGPRFVVVHLPVGALLFLNHRRKIKLKDELVPPAVESPD